MANFLHILSRPDNLPIAGMAVALVFLLGVALRQALRNDRLLKEGGEEAVGRDMRK
mgnify:CR=1 FL=1